ncbi:MAG: hypothetical protein GXP62_02755 [Oligoflexia bacterium]|nr:hypothetical protein [Oligoflexia bacterium]
MSTILTLLLCLILSAHAQAGRVVILSSDQLPAYERPIPAFEQYLDRPVQVYQLEGDKTRALHIAKQLGEDRPALIFALGAKAAWVAVNQLPGVPLVYAAVLDPNRYGIDGAFVTGVGMQLPPDLVLSQFQLFAPNVKRIGIIVWQGNHDPQIEDAIDAARRAGYEVTARRVGHTKDVRRDFASLRRQVDALWILPDPVVVTPQNFRTLRDEALRAHIPILAYGEQLVRAGALMCVAPDWDAVGRQAAGLANKILGGTTASAVRPVAADTPRVLINGDTQDALGMKMDEIMLDFVDEVVRAKVDR